MAGEGPGGSGTSISSRMFVQCHVWGRKTRVGCMQLAAGGVEEPCHSGGSKQAGFHHQEACLVQLKLVLEFLFICTSWLCFSLSLSNCLLLLPKPELSTFLLLPKCMLEQGE